MLAVAPRTPDELADHVHALLIDLEPARFGAEAAARCRALLGQVRVGAAGMLATWSADPDAAPRDPAVVEAVSGVVRAIPASDAAVDWRSVYAALWRAYESLARALRAEGVAAPRLRPTNWPRTLFHGFAGIAMVLAFELALTPATTLLCTALWCVWAWSLEFARWRWPRVNEACMRAFGAFAREHERTSINSATWLGTGLLLLALTVPDPRGLLGVVAIVFGDPVAGFVGRRWGRTKGLHGRSLEGSLGFAGATWVAALGYLRIFHPELAWPVTIASVAVAGVVGAVVEHVTVRIDDNLAVPVAVAAAVALTQTLF